jgi:hypothetical protein
MADRTQIDLLKKQAREKREAREAELSGSAAAETAVPEMKQDTPAAVTDVEQGALAQISSAEALCSALREGVAAAMKTMQAYGKASTAEDATALQASVTALSGKIGALQATVDGISLGELGEDERDAARSRRKKVNAALEEEFMPAVAQLRRSTTSAALLAVAA